MIGPVGKFGADADRAAPTKPEAPPKMPERSATCPARSDQKRAATGGMTDPQRDETRRLLEQAARADSLAARVTAENLLALMEAQYGVN